MAEARMTPERRAEIEVELALHSGTSATTTTEMRTAPSTSARTADCASTTRWHHA